MIVKSIPVLYLTIAFATCSTHHHPQVYEQIEETYDEVTNRTPLQTHNGQRQFNYYSSEQQDQQRNRYNQQQKMDAMNFAKRHGMRSLEQNGDPTETPQQQNSLSQQVQLLEDVNNELTSLQNLDISKIKPTRRTNKSLRPENYYEQAPSDSEISSTDVHQIENQNERHDLVPFQTAYFRQPSVYVDISGKQRKQIPRYLGGFVQTHTTQPEHHIAALNSLIGKPPTDQLHGLHQLLGKQHLNNQRYKDHTPIAEHQKDVPNHQKKPNIRIEPRPERLKPEIFMQLQNFHGSQPHQFIQPPKVLSPQIPISPESLQIQTPPPPAPLKVFQPPLIQHESYPSLQIASPLVAPHRDISEIQAHLDAAAHHQAQTAIAHAQAEAAQHVAAQHQAIAVAKAHAEANAIAKIHAEAEHQAVLALQQTQAQAQAESLAKEDKEQSLRAKAHIAAQTDAHIHAQSIAQDNAIKNNQLASRFKNHGGQKEAEHILAGISLKSSLPKIQASRPNDIVPVKSRSRSKRPLTLLQVPTGFQHSLDDSSTGENIQELRQAPAFKPVALPQVIQRKPQEINADYQNYFVKDEKPIEVPDTDYDDDPAKYAFGYRIRDFEHGNDFSHEEKRDGESVKGHYHVLLPDGRIQNVDYTVDEAGYHAKVTYTNAAS